MSADNHIAPSADISRVRIVHMQDLHLIFLDQAYGPACGAFRDAVELMLPQPPDNSTERRRTRAENGRLGFARLVWA